MRKRATGMGNGRAAAILFVTIVLLLTASFSLASQLTETGQEVAAAEEVPVTCEEGIVNGGFEERTGWTTPATPHQAGYATELVHGGKSSMRTGILEPGDNVFSYSSALQTVTLSRNMPYVNLQFWLFPQTTEPASLSLPSNPLGIRQLDAANSGDAQLVLILNESGAEIERLLMMRENAQEWQYYSFDLSHLVEKGRDRTVKLYFDTYNNGWAGVSSMHVDDVSLTLCTGTPPTADKYLFYLSAIYKIAPLEISGRVVDWIGRPLPGVSVRLNGQETTVTDLDGLYKFSYVEPDDYTITAEGSAYGFTPDTRQVTVPPSAVDQDFAALAPPDPYPGPE